MRAVILISLIALSIFIPGCGNQKENQSQIKAINDTQNIVTASQATDDITRSKQQNSSTAKPISTITTNQPQEIFYGQWVIKKLLAYGSVGTYSKEDIKSIIGRKLSFSKEKASCFGDQVKYIDDVVINPIYKKTDISRIDFSTDYRKRLTFDDLGIKSDSVSQINVADSKGNGCVFFIKDNDTLILQGGGAFFELTREM